MTYKREGMTNMVRIVWGVFVIIAGFSALSWAWFVASVSALSLALSEVSGLSPQAAGAREFYFFVFLALLLFLVGSGLIYWGDQDREQRRVAALRSVLREFLGRDDPDGPHVFR